MVEIENVGNYLSANDIGDRGKKVKILAEGSYIEKIFKDEKRRRLEIPLLLPNGEKKVWTLNRTSESVMAGILGKDTKEWVGKEVYLISVNQIVQGSLKQIIYPQKN